MIPTIVEKQILNSLRTDKLKKQQTDKNLPPPHRCPPFFFLQKVTHAQKALTPRGPQIACKLRSQVSKLRSQVSKLRSQVSKLRRKNRCVPLDSHTL